MKAGNPANLGSHGKQLLKRRQRIHTTCPWLRRKSAAKLHTSNVL